MGACAHAPHLSPVAGTQPADYSFLCAQKFPNGQPAKKVSAPQELNVRSCDMSTWDFSSYTAQELADVLTFDSKTKFPAKDKLPKGFKPNAILKKNKNPGLGLRKLHRQVITGKGVNVAILDQNLLIDHEQYAERIRYYWQDPIYQDIGKASMHGPAVASILAGKTVGVAPQANIYYWANDLKIDDHNILDDEAVAKDLMRIANYNGWMDENNKIRVLSISRGFGPHDKDYEKLKDAIRYLENDANIAVFTTNDVFTLSRTHSLAAPDDTDYCRPAYWFTKEDLAFYDKIQNPSVPSDFRVTAAPNGITDYAHYATGGLSWAVPYMAGLYALGVQVYPDLTKEVFLDAVRQTATPKTCTYQGTPFTVAYFVNPSALITYVQRLNSQH